MDAPNLERMRIGDLGVDLKGIFGNLTLVVVHVIVVNALAVDEDVWSEDEIGWLG
jgi:hypothetical protein